MTHYLPREKLSPAEAEELPRAKPEVLPRLPRDIIFPKVDKYRLYPCQAGYKGLISSLAGIQLTYIMLKSFRQELQGL